VRTEPMAFRFKPSIPIKIRELSVGQGVTQAKIIENAVELYSKHLEELKKQPVENNTEKKVSNTLSSLIFGKSKSITKVVAPEPEKPRIHPEYAAYFQNKKKRRVISNA
tara:strand:+ start:192 stop:518 length:327 start_codon:yes stop_codon:yes gene_type:complete